MCSATGHQVAKGAAYTPREIHYADRTQSGGDRMQFDQLKRRKFITLLGGTTTWPIVGKDDPTRNTSADYETVEVFPQILGQREPT